MNLFNIIELFKCKTQGFLKSINNVYQSVINYFFFYFFVQAILSIIYSREFYILFKAFDSYWRMWWGGVYICQ